MTVEKLTDLKPGIILIEDVYNFQGLLLLKKDTCLTEKNLRMLKSWGIMEVAVAGKSGHPTSESRQNSGNNSRKNVETKIKRKFIRDMDNPIMKKIMLTAMDLLDKRNHGKE